jgi:radical SAM superfamily enzyme
MYDKRMWDDKRYHSLNYYLKNRFGTKMFKLALDAGMTCPNRDGRLGTDGCIFCSQGGSGDFQGI